MPKSMRITRGEHDTCVNFYNKFKDELSDQELMTVNNIASSFSLGDRVTEAQWFSALKVLQSKGWQL